MSGPISAADRSSGDYRNITGEKLDSSETKRGLHVIAETAGVAWDYIGVARPDAVTEVYSFKLGGSTGALQRTITLTFEDASKENLLSVERT